MAPRSAAALLGICFTVMACADSATNRGITAPGTDGVPRSLQTASANAATGGRASGHFELASPFGPIQSEQYSFVALSTGDFPNAKGQLEAKITRPTSFQELHAEVDCLAISGNQAWVSAELKHLVVNGVSQPTAGRYVMWRVQDNGEGAKAPPDMVSLLYVGFPQACLVYFGSEEFILTPTARGNIQVSQR